MRFKVVRATAFGCLKDERLEVAPGFTVIYGLNEAGKSTWHAAMYAALCGVRRGPGATAVETSFRERYQPWTGTRWEVSASLELDDGHCIDLRHDLDGKVNCSAVDATTGRDRSAELTFEGSPDGSMILGINRRIYSKVACIRQADILDILENPQGLQTQLQRTVASPDATATASAALTSLKVFKSAKVGLQRANSTGPLAVAKREVDAADMRLKLARTAHEEYARMVQEAVRLSAEAGDAQTRREVLQARIALDEAQRLEAKLQRMRDLAERNPGGPPPDQRDDDALSLRVATALADFNRMPVVQELNGASAADLRERLDALPGPPAGDTAPHQAVVGAERAWRDACAVLDSHSRSEPAESNVTGSAEDEYELRRWADILRTPVPPVPVELEREASLARQRVANASGLGLRSRLLLGVGMFVAAAGVLAALFGFMPGLAALLGGLALAGAGVLSRPSMPIWRAVEEQGKAEASLEAASAERTRIHELREHATRTARDRGLVPVPEELVKQADRIARDRALAETAAAFELRRQQLIEDEHESAEALRRALRQRGEAVNGDVGTSYEAYSRTCALRAAQLEESNQRVALQAELQLRLEQERAVETARAQATAALAALQAAASEVAASGTPEQQAAALRQWQEDRTQRQAADDLTRREWQELQGLRQDSPEEDRQRDITRLREQAVALDPEGRAATVSLGPDPHEQLEREQDAELAADRDARALTASCEQFARTMPSVSEAEEQFELAAERLNAVRELDGVLERTIQFLTQAEQSVQRDIAPVLSQSVGPRLSNVTADRYARVAVDPANLKVTVFDASGAPHSATSLSHGTSEQVYLLLRVALAELFARSGESVPLLLDDVTVESDRIRTKAILSVLHELSASHQVVLFTQEDDVLEWAQANLVEPNDATRVLN